MEQKMAFALLVSVALMSSAFGESLNANDVVQDRSELKAVFSPDQPGAYTFEVTVSDGCSSFSDVVNYDVQCTSLPRADAGDAKTLVKDCGTSPTVRLDGSSSFSTSENPSYKWSVERSPGGEESGSLINGESAVVTFVPEKIGTYILGLEVSDCCGTSFVTTNVTYACNHPPVANAGPDKVVPKGEKVVIDATESGDPDQDALTYSWEILSSPEESLLGSHDLIDSTTSTPALMPDVKGKFILQLTVSDCCNVNTDEVVVEVVCNDPPAANAGDDISVTGTQLVTLDGSSSSDPNRSDRLVYSWEFVTVPPKSELTNSDIQGYNVVHAEFTPDVFGIYEVELIVSDCCSESRSRKKITVGCNTPPVAIAGDEQTVTGTRPYPSVSLQGCKSSDVDGDNLAYEWTFVSIPDKSRLTDANINNRDQCGASFVPDTLGLYELRISVTDHCTHDNDTVRVVVGCNFYPVADAGPQQDVTKSCVGTRVSLDGSGSNDPDGDELRYGWDFVSVPDGSNLNSKDIEDSHDMRASFMPDVKGTYVVELTVTDSCTSDKDRARIFYGCNRAPVSNAGPDRVVTGSFPWDGVVSLFGSGSSDPDDDKIHYEWSFTHVPDGSKLSSAAIIDPLKETASFVPDLPGRYELQLTVSDCCSEGRDVVVITVSCGSPPTANGGADQFLVQDCNDHAKVINLDGSGSRDPDNHELKYQWSFITVPEGSHISDASITHANDAHASFTLSASDRVSSSDEYVVELSVSDSCSVVTDRVKITFCCNNAPTAHAGVDRTFSSAPPFPPVNLDGSTSVDPDHDAVTYEWHFIHVPESSALVDANIFNAYSTKPYFSPDIRGQYTLELTVRDCCSTISDRVTITITCDDPPEAHAGPDQFVAHFCNKLNTIRLDGTKSSDPNSELVSYLWTFLSIPKDSSLGESAIVDPNSPIAHFAPDVTGEYEVKLVVSDGCSLVSDTVMIEYTCDGVPTANAGDDQSIVQNPPFPLVHMTGTGSSDPYGDILNYEWRFVSIPAGSRLTDSSITYNAIFALGGVWTPDAPGCYTLELTAVGCCAKASDTTQVCLKCNEAPHAFAGKDQEFVKQAVRPTVYLDGCQSSDPDEEDTLTYSWKFFNKPTDSQITDNDIFHSKTCQPSFSPDVTGQYELELVVYDGCTQDRDNVKIKYRCNNTPHSDAGADRSVVKECGNPVSLELDGSGSYDPDDDPLRFEWTFSSVPSGSSLHDESIHNRNSQKASFTPDVYGNYVLQLSSHDYCFTVTDEVRITFKCNDPPIPDAGTDQDITAFPFPIINLDGSHSRDPDGDDMYYKWTLVQAPSGSQINTEDIVDATQPKSVFIPDVAGIYIFSLQVRDCCSTVTDEVKITINKRGCNEKPVVDAGDDVTVTRRCSERTNVLLDGSRSVDMDNDALTFKWRLTGKPEGSIALESDIRQSTSAKAYFTPDVVGDYTLSLIVSDGCSTVSDEVFVHYACNSVPDANAGQDINIDTSGSITNLPKVAVSGARSTDPEGDELTYSWDFISKAEGSCMTKEKLDCDGSACSFYPDVRGCYDLELTVSDCCAEAKDTIRVCLTCQSSPVANAGLDQSVRACPPYPRVYLHAKDDNSGTSNNHLFTWKFIDLPKDSILDSNSITNANSADAYFTADVMGVYELMVTVGDGCSTNSDTIQIDVGCNAGPTANAGLEQLVHYDGKNFPKVYLNGEGSTDPDSDTLSYEWSFNTVPAGSALNDGAIVNRDTPKGTFWPDKPGAYELSLKVSDCCSPSEDTVIVNVQCDGIPSVDAGADQTIQKGCGTTTVVLEGTASDPDGDQLSFEWSFVTIPPQSKLSDSKISNRHSPRAFFVPDVTGSFFELQLLASDGCTTLKDRVKIDYECNAPPNAHAGPDQTLIKSCASSVVYLDGSGSLDPDNDPLSYDWHFTTVPTGSKMTNDQLVNQNTPNPSFAPDITGLYELELTVADCCMPDHIRCTCMKDRVLVTLTCKGVPPYADAGPNQVAHWDEAQFPVVAVDASGSYDDDHDALSFKWTFASIPSMSKLMDKDILNAEDQRASFVPDVNGDYELVVSVGDCCFIREDTLIVTVKCDSPPTTYAGPDQVVSGVCNTAGSPVFLDGNLSGDPDKENLQCSWRFCDNCKPTKSMLTDADIYRRDSLNAFFYADVLGDYVLELTCFDGCSYVPDEVVVHVGCNDAPHAEVASDTVTIDCSNNVYHLDGSQSSDPNGDSLTYEWTIIRKPDDSGLTNMDIQSADSADAYIIPDVTGTFEIQLNVSDCCQHSTAVSTISVLCTAPPTASAGISREVDWDGITNVRATVKGSSSTDPDSKNLNYHWKFVSVPEESALVDTHIVHADEEEAYFVPDAFGVYELQLSVSDCCSTSSDNVAITVKCNTVHKADAGPDENLQWECGVEFPLEVTLDGDLNHDASYNWRLLKFNENRVPVVDAGCDYEGAVQRVVHLNEASVKDGDSIESDLRFTWSFESVPYGSELTNEDIYARHNRDSSFVPDREGVYVVALTVTDGVTTSSDTSSVFVHLYTNSLGTHDVLAEEEMKVFTTSATTSFNGLVVGLCVAFAAAIVVIVGLAVKLRHAHQALEIEGLNVRMMKV